LFIPPTDVHESVYRDSVDFGCISEGPHCITMIREPQSLYQSVTVLVT